MTGHEGLWMQLVAVVDKEIVMNMKKFRVRFITALSFVAGFQMAVNSLLLNLTSPVCTS
jgi:hypothetical protein